MGLGFSPSSRYIQARLYRLFCAPDTVGRVTDHPPPQAPPSPDELAATLRTAISALVRAARPSDRLAPIPATVLDLLDRRGPMTTAELAASRGVRHQTMAATVKELTEAGLVTAGPDPADARKKALALTPAGAEAIAADRGDRVGLLAQAIGESLTGDERHVLARALPLIDRVAGTIARGAPPGDRGTITGAW
ncbi:MAG: MarR family transcriptional regulator [Streptomyces sp.]|nr:MarR family transcriptional regulator [Streptomyces sp.]